MTAAYVTTDGSDFYHSTAECPWFRRGYRGNPVRPVTADELASGRREQCKRCAGEKAER